jgi:putative membrane protein
MTGNPYERFKHKELILRDELAIDRTLLANERTVLAYLRGALTLFIAGVTFLHFFYTGMLFYIGIFCIFLGLAIGILGVLRYLKMNKSIRIIRESLSRNEDVREQAKQPSQGNGMT